MPVIYGKVGKAEERCPKKNKLGLDWRLASLDYAEPNNMRHDCNQLCVTVNTVY